MGWLLISALFRVSSALLAKFAKILLKCQISQTLIFISGHCIGHMGSWSFSNWGSSRLFFFKSINNVYHVKDKTFLRCSMKNIQFYLDMFDVLTQNSQMIQITQIIYSFVHPNIGTSSFPKVQMGTFCDFISLISAISVVSAFKNQLGEWDEVTKCEAIDLTKLSWIQVILGFTWEILIVSNIIR